MAQLLLAAGAGLRSRVPAAFTAALGLVLLSGCTSVFFYPTDRLYVTPDELGLSFSDVQIITPDNEQLHGWWLPAEGSARGTVYFLHGNAQNISAHVVNVSWLPVVGYNVFLLDYRGYGRSTGDPDLEGVLIDSMAGLKWAVEHSPDLPVFVLGQSLGGALAVLTSHQAEFKPAGVIIDGAFAGFRQIAREKLHQFWLTWPGQAPLSWLIPASHEPLDIVGQLELPLLVIHSEADAVVPFHHGQQLYEAAQPPKQFLGTETPHGATFTVYEFRQTVVEFMGEYEDRGAAD